MGYVHGKTIKKLESEDGTRQADIIARDDGLFQFYEYFLLSDDEGERWTFKRMSGLYDTAEGAEAVSLAYLKL